MPALRHLFRRLKLRNLLFLLLLLSGIIPLAVSSVLLIGQNRELLTLQEKTSLARSARFLSVQLDGYLATTRAELARFGQAILTVPPAGPAEEKLREPWLVEHLENQLAGSPDLVALRLLDARGVGPYVATARLPEEVATTLAAAFDIARSSAAPVARLVVLPEDNEPLAVLAVPVGGVLFVEAVARVPPIRTFFTEEARDDVAVFLVDRDGQVLWSVGSDLETDRAVAASSEVRSSVELPWNQTAEYTLRVGGEPVRMLARISPVAETGWGVVMHKPVKTAFGAVRKMLRNTAISTAVLIALALTAAAFAARRVSRPIQRLTETSHEIAAGNFGKRVEAVPLGAELGKLAEDFNRMSDHVQQYVERLQRAAQANRELFIGSMRAFVAAVDAKDPYTRGHSERVAAHSRTIAKFLGMDDSFQHRIWVGALLHDVGKIGIEDAILKKGGVLTDAEYEQMKQHPVIGAQIMSRIEQLKEMIPAIRWHHEAWNGRGYPDGLRGEQIPLMARIVGVADTFDAITTNRPYQRAYEPEFALETIRKLAGARFDAKVVTAFLRAFEAGQIRIRKQQPVAVAAEPAAASG